MILLLRRGALGLLVLYTGLVCACAESFSFIHITDTHITTSSRFGPNLSAIVSEINSMQPPPAFALVTGDQTELGFAEEYAKFSEIISLLKVPVYHVMGNHETKWSNWGRKGIQRFFHQEPSYSFDHGGVHFVALDTTMWLEHNGFLDGGRLDWLQKDLAKTGPESPVVLFYHHCPGFVPTEPELLKLLSPFNVRLALVGHGHEYDTWQQNGIVFQMTMAAMKDKGGYRIEEVSDGVLRSYTKRVGEPRVLDREISFAKPKDRPGVRLLSPKEGESIQGNAQVRVKLESGKSTDMSDVEMEIGGTTFPLHKVTDREWRGKLDWRGAPGWRRLIVRSTQPGGSRWTDSAVVCVNKGERVKWQTELRGGLQRPATASAGRLYVPATGDGVHCLDAATGRKLWLARPGDDILSELAIDQGRIFGGSTDGYIFALDAKTGKTLWEHETSGPIQGSPAVDDSTVYIGSGDCGLDALDVKTGTLKWRFETAKMVQVRPLIVKGSVYFGAWDQHFYALNAADGSLKWKTRIGDMLYFSPANSNPACDGSRIVVASSPWRKNDSDIFCLDSATGQVLWKRRNPGGTSQCAFSSPWVAGDRFYIATLAGEVFCLSMRDGSQIWRSEIGEETYDNSPILKSGKIFIGGLRGELFCLDAADGKKLWSYSIAPDYMFASPTVTDRLVIGLSSSFGTVTALTWE